MKMHINISTFILLTCLSVPIFSVSLSAQKLGPYLVSTSGQSYSNNDLTVYVSIGEPINTVESEGSSTISQGVLQSIFQAGNQGIENCSIEQGRMFFQDCDDGTQFFFIEDQEGRILDPYYGEGVTFEEEDGITVDFGYTIAEFDSPCSAANQAVILTCVSKVLSTSSSDILIKDVITLYPNPSNGQFYLESTNLKLENTSIRVFNNMGVDLTSQIQTNIRNKRIDMSTLLSGLYIVQFSTEDGVINKRVVIQR